MFIICLGATRCTKKEGVQAWAAELTRLSPFCWGLNCHRVDILPTCTFPSTQERLGSRTEEQSWEPLVGVQLQGEFEKQM